MNETVISGIQQVGIGVSNADEAFKWYRDLFGFDIQVFAEAAEAPLMTRYTGGNIHKRYAILALNLQGGGGLEIWQYTSRTAQPAKEPLVWGKPGIMAIKIRCKDVAAFHREAEKKGVNVLSKPAPNCAGKQHFYLRDPYGNIFELIEEKYWFTHGPGLTGGICGVTVAVSNLRKSIPFYQAILGVTIKHNDNGVNPEDWKGLPLSETPYSIAILGSKPGPQPGAFGKLLGNYEIELIQAEPGLTGNILKNRFWGDLGYIHVCFDIKGYDCHTANCQRAGARLTIDSGDFSMGDAAGRFSYNEDPDGTLLEYVETYKVPILKKIGWFLNLKKRPAATHLPDWMVKALRFSRVKA